MVSLVSRNAHEELARRNDCQADQIDRLTEQNIELREQVEALKFARWMHSVDCIACAIGGVAAGVLVTAAIMGWKL